MPKLCARRSHEDLLARLNLWTFRLPGLADRREDIEPNLDYELDRYAERNGEHISFNREARARYLAFAVAPSARWSGSFRDLAASVTRTATFAPKGRIDGEVVESEIARLQQQWGGQAGHGDGLEQWLPDELLSDIDPFDRVQLAHVVATCQQCRSLSEAGRVLFAASRRRRASTNDADRLRKYLARFGLEWTAMFETRRS